MNRLLTLIVIGLAGLLASCGSSVKSTTQPATNDEYSVVVSPDRLTLNAGDWTAITARVDVSNQNQGPKAVSPQPTLKFFSSDARVTVSPAGEVCAGLWDTKYLTCTATTVPATGLLNLPVGPVTITAYNASHNVSGTTLATVHQRAFSISLGANWGSRKCISQNDPTTPSNNQVQYSAHPVDANGNAIANIFANDYTWVVDDPNVAAVSSFGFVVARNPGVTHVFATLNGTKSAALAFATCPPASIVLASSGAKSGVPFAPFSTADLNTLQKGDQTFLTATQVDTNGNQLAVMDANGNPLVTLPLNFITSNPLAGSLTSDLPLTSKLSAITSGRFSVMVSCEPPICNASVPDFNSPAGPISGKAAGFGYPIYSNVIGVTVLGTTGSTVLVTNSADSASIKPPLNRLEAYDSESMTQTQTVVLLNLPNSLVIAPNGLKAYLGSSDGLMVVDLTNYQATLQAFPIAGGLSTDVVTGKVLGVSPDSRFVLISDVAKGLVFYIDTTGTKVATRHTIPNINAVTFAADGSNTWIAGTGGVYTFNSDSFVKPSTNASSGVKALAWTPDGQSYFASGDQLTNYSTCDDQNPQAPQPNLPTSVLGGLSTTVLAGVPHLVGLSSGNQWFDYSVTTTAQVGNPTPQGFVCLSQVTINPPVSKPSALGCTAQQISFSPTLEKEFVTGVDSSACAPQSVIFGYDVIAQSEILLPTTNPIIPLSGGVLNDGRKLFVGTYSSSAGGLLHRFDLASGTEDAATTMTGTAPNTVTTVTIPANVGLVPSFVAVVPK